VKTEFDSRLYAQNTGGASNGMLRRIFSFRPTDSNMAAEHFILEAGLTNLYLVTYYDADPITRDRTPRTGDIKEVYTQPI
jgi:hypothetical protein